MHLAQLHICNFRACKDTTVDFAPDVTVIVGENASGKSAIIDALQLATFPASGRPAAWFTSDRDLNRGAEPGTTVTVSARYGELSDVEKAIYMAEIIDQHEDLIYTASFATSSGTPRRSQLSWAVGEMQAEDPEPMLRRRIAHVYLPPLRDAVRDLDGGDQPQLLQVMKMLIGSDSEKQQRFVARAQEAIASIASEPLATDTRDAIQAFFSETVPPNRQHDLRLNEREMELRRIARLLRLQLAEGGVTIGDIASTGLGYANLLYIAMVVLQLARAREYDLTILLVEEPEAHLHPQLQLVLLDFLKKQAAASGRSSPEEMETLGPDAAAGKVQVIVTTHSPVLASTVSVQNIVVVARDSEGAEWSSQAVALGRLGLSDPDRRKIDRYLNSTRAALLFARDIVLVEGIAELLLLPALAEHRIRASGRDAPTIEAQLRQFRSATIVSVEGVDFEPYLHLLLDGTHARIDRVVVITDRDHTGAGTERKSKYESLFSSAQSSGRLTVVVGGTTLEAEMFREAPNEPLLRKAFETLHPASMHHWEKVLAAVERKSQDERAELFARAIRAKSATEEYFLDIGKGDFAHLVAEAILLQDAETSLSVPTYLGEAIDLVAHVQRQVANR